MTDRELLELAAKAARLDVTWHSEDDANHDAVLDGMYLKGVRSVDNSQYWNPLAKDGDAFRLAVRLGLSVQVNHDSSQPLPWLRVVDGEQRWIHAMVKEYGAEPEAATRRAIVRAAAQIGKNMP